MPIAIRSRLPLSLGVLETITKWLTQNAVWLGSLGSLAAILSVAFVVVKPLREIPVKWWSSLRRPSKRRKKRVDVTLKFVSQDLPYSYWGIGKQDDKPITCIVARWHVTQIPGSGVSVQLLNAHLVKPAVSQDLMIHSHVHTMSDEWFGFERERVIPEAETRDVVIRCAFLKVLDGERPLEVRFVVEDQFANKHRCSATVKRAPLS
jgi:hypothetical protein